MAGPAAACVSALEGPGGSAAGTESGAMILAYTHHPCPSSPLRPCPPEGAPHPCGGGAANKPRQGRENVAQGLFRPAVRGRDSSMLSIGSPGIGATLSPFVPLPRARGRGKGVGGTYRQSTASAVGRNLQPLPGPSSRKRTQARPAEQDRGPSLFAVPLPGLRGWRPASTGFLRLAVAPAHGGLPQ